jgi:hypothetical protein
MYYLVYQVVNLINGKIYIGVHGTLDINDSYMGSGKHLKHAQKKYGIENFEKHILHIFDSSDPMFEMEAALVNEEFLARPDTYNIVLGGKNPLDYVNETNHNNKGNHRKTGNYGFKITPLDRTTQKYRDALSVGAKVYYAAGGINPFKGKTHTAKTKKLIGAINSKKQQGINNSQYGTCWIHSLELKSSKRIKADVLEEWINKGWVKGRKINW